MPMIALSVVLLFRKPRRPRAIGCALAGLALISQLREAIDGIARMMSIAPDDHAMMLAMFRTIFNVLGVTLMLLLLDLLIGFLIRSIPRTRPRYQSPSLSVRGRGRVPPDLRDCPAQGGRASVRTRARVDPARAQPAPRSGLSDSRSAGLVRQRRTSFEVDIDEACCRRVRTLDAGIVEVTARVGDKRLDQDIAERVRALCDAASTIVQVEKSVKHLRKNILRHTVGPRGVITELMANCAVGSAGSRSKSGRCAKPRPTTSARCRWTSRAPGSGMPRGWHLGESTRRTARAR